MNGRAAAWLRFTCDLASRPTTFLQTGDMCWMMSVCLLIAFYAAGTRCNTWAAPSNFYAKITHNKKASESRTNANCSSTKPCVNYVTGAHCDEQSGNYSVWRDPLALCVRWNSEACVWQRLCDIRISLCADFDVISSILISMFDLPPHQTAHTRCRFDLSVFTTELLLPGHVDNTDNHFFNRRNIVNCN